MCARWSASAWCRRMKCSASSVVVNFGGDGAALGAGAFGASNGDHGTCQLMVSPCWRICSRYLTTVTVELKHFGGSVPPVTM
ncbi:hypothetical protein Henu3_gp15 [Mycobacterium phage Henu3 PeY-2017]|nr:hypothetical protein Henu3_gp15 [Mycobacterium phage Henu3 PeY-2017]